MIESQPQDAPVPGPLQGVRILDLGRVLAAPFCSMILGDLGADVIKVEHAKTGDDTRAWKPPEVGGDASYYMAVNRNKRSIGIDLATDAGRDVLLQLAANSDVLVENFRPGVTERLGIDYPQVAQRKADIIYCSISGFGQSGPLSKRAAYDYVVQAMSGVMSLTGEKDGAPFRCAGAISDYGSGLYAVIAVMAALMERQKTGEGQHIDLSMLDCTMTYIGHLATQFLVDREPPRRLGNGHEKIVPMDVYQTADEPLMVLCGNDGMFKRLVEAMGIGHYAEDERFRTNLARSQNLNALESFMQAQMRTDTRENWMRRLTEADIPFAPVRSVPEVLDAEEATAREMVVDVPHPIAGSVQLLGSPLKLGSGSVRVDRRPPPALSQHSREVLSDILQMDAATVDELIRSGAIGDYLQTP